MNTARIMLKKMSLSELLGNAYELAPGFDTELTGIEIDSRRVEAGDLFLACKGTNFDGREFIPQVIAAGANAVLVEKDEKWNCAQLIQNVPVIPVSELAVKTGKLAARFYDYPAAALCLIGITGTNGKTSTCQFIGQAVTLLGNSCGVCGTLGYGVAGETLQEAVSGPSTTPDAVSVQQILEEVRVRGAGTMAMEVSSHGLQQQRVNVNEFDVAVFTNLSRDHMDYHGSMQAYGDQKRKLFTGNKLQKAVVNLDDLFAAQILNTLVSNVQALTFSLSNTRADVYPEKIAYLPHGIRLNLVSPWGDVEFSSSLLGSFNVSNLLAAFTTVAACMSQEANFEIGRIAEAFSNVQPVSGRMEMIGDFPLAVVVDYAHTPDGLKNALAAVREHFNGRVWCVFGCGGDRDTGKRPLMAAIAEEFADVVVVTDDNPRHEASDRIVRNILSGFKKPGIAEVIQDRAAAIEWALMQAEVADVVLIAGKGHEEYQDVGGRRTTFSDVKQARVILNRRFNS